MKDIVEQFKDHGMSASYHYADDSCREWGAGDREKSKAMKLFNDNPDLQDDMSKVAEKFLWAPDFKRLTS